MTMVLPTLTRICKTQH